MFAVFPITAEADCLEWKAVSFLFFLHFNCQLKNGPYLFRGVGKDVSFNLWKCGLTVKQSWWLIPSFKCCFFYYLAMAIQI